MRRLAVVALALCLPACGHGAKACAVVDVAHDACSVVRVLTPSGDVEEISSQELGNIAVERQRARAKAAAP